MGPGRIWEGRGCWYLPLHIVGGKKACCEKDEGGGRYNAVCNLLRVEESRGRNFMQHFYDQQPQNLYTLMFYFN